jgi:hypothetical protein
MRDGAPALAPVVTVVTNSANSGSRQVEMANKNQNTLKLVVVGLAAVTTIVAVVTLGTHRSRVVIDFADTGLDAQAAAVSTAVAAALANTTVAQGKAMPALSDAASEDATSTTAVAIGDTAADAGSDATAPADATVDAHLASAPVSVDDVARPAPELLDLARRAFESEAPRLYLSSNYVLAKRSKIGDLRILRGNLAFTACLGDLTTATPSVTVKSGNYAVEVVTAKDVGGLLARVVIAPGRVEKVVSMPPTPVRASLGVGCFADPSLFPLVAAQHKLITDGVSAHNAQMTELEAITHGNIAAFDTAHEEREVSVYRALGASDQLLYVFARTSDVAATAPLTAAPGITGAGTAAH